MRRAQRALRDESAVDQQNEYGECVRACVSANLSSRKIKAASPNEPAMASLFGRCMHLNGF